MEITPRFIIEEDDHVLLARFTVWMEKVVRNAAIDYHRRQKSRSRELSLDNVSSYELSYEDPLPVSKAEFEFEEGKISETFLKLDLLRRRILTLTFVEGLTAQETADRLGCPLNLVYLHKHRAIKKMRDHLMDGGDKHGN